MLRNTGKRIWISCLVIGVAVTTLVAALACGSEATPTPRATAAPATAMPGPTTVPVPTAPAMGQPRQGGDLRVAGIQGGLTLRTLDPHFSVQADEYQVMFSIYNNIVKLGPNLDIQPDLARDWEISNDGRAITFRLPGDVKFHDGTNFTAQSVKWNMERIMDPDLGSSQAALLVGVVDSIDVLDTTTIRFNLVKPHRPFLATMADRPGMIISPTEALKYEAGPIGGYGANPSGTGPFQLDRWIPDGDVTAVRFRDYWEPGKPYLDSIRFIAVSDQATQLAMLRTGESDMDQVRQVDLPIIANNPDIKLVEHQSGAYYGLQISLWEEPWTNKALRQAIAHAIDRETVCSTYFADRCRLAYTPEGIGWVYNPDIKPYPYDPEMARAKLAEAGYPNGVELPIWFSSGNADYGELMQAMLREIGITLNIINITSQDWFTLRAQKRSHFMYASWFPRADPNNRLVILHHSGGWANSTGYNDPVTDDLLDRAAQEYDLVRAKALYDQIQTRVTESAHIQYHIYTNVYMGTSANVNGFEWIPDLFPRIREVWLSQ